MTDNTGRFSGRAAVYERTRPTYPKETIALIGETCRVGPGVVVADLGAGTGIFTSLLVDAGATVFAVEPNADMRARVAPRERLRVIDGTAEATTLADASCDLVTAAQAFHWFDGEAARREVLRILREGGAAALVYNDRDLASTPFLRAFEELLTTLPPYAALQGKASATERFDAFFGAGRWTRLETTNAQRLDREGLFERAMSASYAPMPGAPGHDDLRDALGALFDRHAAGGEVELRYTTVVIAGRLK